MIFASHGEFSRLLYPRSIGMQSLHNIGIGFAVLVIAAGSLAQSNNQQRPESLTFVRQLTSAADVRKQHTVVDKALDIVAGPKDDSARSNVLESPTAVATDTAGRVLVLDSTERAIHVFDFANGKHHLLQSAEHLQSPVALATDQNDNVLVTDRKARSVLVFDANGKFIHDLMRTREKEPYFEGPQGIAVDRDSGLIFVCDTARNMVIIVDGGGKVVGRIGKRGGGTGAAEFRQPTEVAVADRKLFVLDARNDRIQVFDMQGHFQRQMPAGDATIRSGLAIDSANRIYISQPGIGQLQVLAQDGRILYTFGQSGVNPGQFSGPSGLWVNSGCLYVADTGNRRVQELRVNDLAAAGCP